MNFRLVSAALVTALAVAVSLGWVVPPSISDALMILFRSDDTVKVATYRMRQLDEQDYDLALEGALEGSDFSLAKQLIEFADESDVNVEEEHRAAAYPSISRQLSQLASDSAAGALTGDFVTPAGLAGAIASDLSGIGDVRDVVLQGKAAMQGQEYDIVVLGLASAGIVLTGGALLSAGAASPADTGVSVMKNAYKTGQVSQPLLKHIRRSTDGLVDIKLLRTKFSDIENVRPSRAKEILEASIDFGKLDVLAEMSKNVGRVSSNADLSTAVSALRYAENSEDLTRAANLSSHFGKQSRAVFSLLGRGALVATGLLFSVAAWVLAAMLWMIAAMWVVYRFIRMIAVLLWQRA